MSLIPQKIISITSPNKSRILHIPKSTQQTYPKIFYSLITICSRSLMNRHKTDTTLNRQCKTVEMTPKIIKKIEKNFNKSPKMSMIIIKQLFKPDTNIKNTTALEKLIQRRIPLTVFFTPKTL